jgi:hypothetical protein
MYINLIRLMNIVIGSALALYLLNVALSLPTSELGFRGFLLFGGSVLMAQVGWVIGRCLVGVIDSYEKRNQQGRGH